MRLYLEPIFSYNEFEQELQYLELSSLIEDDNGNVVRENTLTFTPIFGVDTMLLSWIGRHEKLVGNNNYKEEVEKEFKEINEIINQDTLILSWNDVFTQMEQINSNKRVSVYRVTGEETTLEKVYKKVTGDALISNLGRERLLATKVVYEHYRGKPNSLTDNKREEEEIQTSTISEDINE